MHAMADYVVFVSPCSFHKLFMFLKKPTGRQLIMMRQYLENSAYQNHLSIQESFKRLEHWLPGSKAARRSEVVRDLTTLRRVSITLYAFTCIMQHLSNAV